MTGILITAFLLIAGIVVFACAVARFHTSAGFDKDNEPDEADHDFRQGLALSVVAVALIFAAGMSL